MLVQLGLADQACILLVKRRTMHGGVFVDRKTGGKQLRVRLGFEIHVETISISTDFLATHTETISTRNNIAIINHLSLNALNCFIIATKTYICLFISILWNDLEISTKLCMYHRGLLPIIV